MTDSRPRPEYGEYATPEQQAAAMGKVYVPLQPAPAQPTSAQPTSTQPTSAQQSPARQTSARQAPGTPRVAGGHIVDRFITVFQLGIGFVLLLNSDFFQLAENANAALAQLGVSERIPVAIDQYAWLLLGANIVLLLATAAWALRTLRRGRLAFYIPAVGYIAFASVLGVVISVLR